MTGCSNKRILLADAAGPGDGAEREREREEDRERATEMVVALVVPTTEYLSPPPSIEPVAGTTSWHRTTRAWRTLRRTRRAEGIWSVSEATLSFMCLKCVWGFRVGFKGKLSLLKPSIPLF